MNAGVWRKMSLYLRKIHTDFGISLYYKKEGNAIGNWNFIQKIQKQYDALIGREVEVYRDQLRYSPQSVDIFRRNRYNI